MRSRAILLLSLTWAVAAGATNPVSLGYTDDGTVIGAGPDNCGTGTPIANHDGTFENGYAWQYGGIAPPYYGAFGEGFVTPFPSSNILTCARLWVTTLPGLFYGQSCDIYIWDGGTTGPPGDVLAMLPGVVLSNVPNWPTVGENAVDWSQMIPGDFTIGYWGNWPGASCGYYCAVDLDGLGGHPWTYLAPNLGYPSGWQDPSVVWGPTQSMGLGAECEQGIPSPAESRTWGAIKALFE
jgi:hypothetical protein